MEGPASTDDAWNTYMCDRYLGQQSNANIEYLVGDRREILSPISIIRYRRPDAEFRILVVREFSYFIAKIAKDKRTYAKPMTLIDMISCDVSEKIKSTYNVDYRVFKVGLGARRRVRNLQGDKERNSLNLDLIRSTDRERQKKRVPTGT